MVISLLEQREALAEPEGSAGRYAELLRLAASQSRLGIIPATLDCVLVIGADRVMPGMVKHAFVMDFTQDSFPKPPTTGGLLTDLDKQSLRSHHMALSPGGVQESLEESYYAYLAMMAPDFDLCFALGGGAAAAIALPDVAQGPVSGSDTGGHRGVEADAKVHLRARSGA